MAAGAESLPSPLPGGPGRVVSSRVRAAGEAPAGAGGSARSAASRAARVRARAGSAAGRPTTHGARGERAPRGAFAARGFLARSPASPSRGGFVFAASLISARREFDPFWTHLTVTFYG